MARRLGGSSRGRSSSSSRRSSQDEYKGRRIGRILTKMGLVTREQVHEALALQQKNRRVMLGQLLIELGYITEVEVNKALAAQAGMEMLDLSKMEIGEDAIKALPSETAMNYQVLPVAIDKTTNTITIALKDPSNYRAVDDIRMLLGFEVIPALAEAAQVDEMIKKHYGGGGAVAGGGGGDEDDESLSSLLGEMADDTAFEDLKDRSDASIDLETQLDMAENNKVKRLLNLVLMQAIKDKASDIHFEPFEDEFKMRYRIDGVLYEMIPPPKHLAPAIVSRIKVMADLDIAERRLPQDGRISLTVAGNPVDLRVSILPTMFGESSVLRVLDRSNTTLDIDKIGLRTDDLDTFQQLIRKPNGIVIVTGPTGSGKTTTLYAALSELNEPTEKILTAEDPVEYDIEGLMQVQVNSEVGLTFAAALRSFLRQDPDIVLIGETRDLETAQIAVQASLTGHLVFTTLHTNDAPSSIARLLDLGLEPFLVTATLEGIVAQRLVRRICTSCKDPFDPTEEQLMELELKPHDIEGRQLYRGRGCDNCNNSGYKGRLALFELMVFDDRLRELVMEHASTQILRAEAEKRGMRSLRQCGLLALYDGITTIDEVVRETIIDG